MSTQNTFEDRLNKDFDAMVEHITPQEDMFDNIMQQVGKRRKRNAPYRKYMAAASIIIILFATLLFSPTVNALVDRVMYLVVRDGYKYNVVEQPYDESKLTKVTATKASSTQEVLGVSLELPDTIIISGESYVAGQNIVCINAKTSEKSFSLQYLTKEMKTASQLETSLNYVLLEISKNKGMLDGGDNLKEVTKDGYVAYWGENPYTNTRFVTEKPESVKAYHALTWESNGLYYRLVPGEGFDMSVEAAWEAFEALNQSK